MVYIGLVSTINGFEQTINLKIKVNSFVDKGNRYAHGEEKTFMQNLCLRLSKNIMISSEISQQDYVFHCFFMFVMCITHQYFFQYLKPHCLLKDHCLTSEKDFNYCVL